MAEAFENRPPHVAASTATLHWSRYLWSREVKVLLGTDLHRANVAHWIGIFGPVERQARKVSLRPGK